MLPILLPLLCGAFLIGLSVGWPHIIEYRRAKVKERPFPKHWRKIIQKRMPYFRELPTDLQLQLKQHIQVFINEKRFIGCNGVEINDEIKVTIAAQACLLILNRKTNYYPKLTTILVYPRGFVKKQIVNDSSGIQHTNNIALSGESWDQGKVILSWQDTKDGANQTDDGCNVVIHEFAHQLDQEKGVANGAPILGKDLNYERWSEVFTKQFELLKKQKELGLPSIFDYYGASEPAEFFAVASEVFFEKPNSFKRHHPELYQELSTYYRVNPVLWGHKLA